MARKTLPKPTSDWSIRNKSLNLGLKAFQSCFKCDVSKGKVFWPRDLVVKMLYVKNGIFSNFGRYVQRRKNMKMKNVTFQAMSYYLRMTRFLQVIGVKTIASKSHNRLREHSHMTSDDFWVFLTYLPTLIRYFTT